MDDMGVILDSTYVRLFWIYVLNLYATTLIY